MTETAVKMSNDLSIVNAAARRWLAEGQPLAEATVIETWGSAPVGVGGRMIIANDDAFQGSVSGGCVEADVIALALGVIADGNPKSMTFGIADETAWRAGLPCGCKIRVLVRPMDDDETGKAAEAVRNDRRLRVVATNLQDGSQRLYERADGAAGEIATAFASGSSQIVQSDSGEIFLNVLRPAPRIAIVGATHVAQILTELAKTAGYDVVVVDPRSAFASVARFDPSTAITAWPEAEIRDFAADPFTAIVTLTHVGHIDDEALKIAIRSPCGYVGALGSRKTHADRVARLKTAGFTDAEIARIRAPIGLNIGGRSPGEIAVSILAEVVAAFHGKLPA